VNKIFKKLDRMIVRLTVQLKLNDNTCL